MPRLAVYRRVEGWPVYAAAARPESAVRATWWSNIAGELAVGLPAWGLLLGLAGAVWRRQRALGEADATLEQRVAARTQALAESEAQLRLAQEAAGIGTWEWDAASRLIRWSDEQYALFGLDAAREPRITFARFLEPWCTRRTAQGRGGGAGGAGDRQLRGRVPHPAAAAGRGDRAALAARPRPAAARAPWPREAARGESPGESPREWHGDRLIGVNVDITDRHLEEERRALWPMRWRIAPRTRCTWSAPRCA